MKKCEACGTKNVFGSLGGVLLCKEHYADISAQVESLRAEGKQVNVMGIARQMFRTQHAVSNYILRDIPKDIWERAKRRSFDDGLSLREVILQALDQYLS